MCILYVSYVYPICILCVSYMYPMCILYVSYVYPTCNLYVSYMYPMCILYVSRVYPICILYVSYVYPMCILCVSYMYPMCMTVLSKSTYCALLKGGQVRSCSEIKGDPACRGCGGSRSPSTQRIDWPSRRRFTKSPKVCEGSHFWASEECVKPAVGRQPLPLCWMRENPIA